MLLMLRMLLPYFSRAFVCCIGSSGPRWRTLHRLAFAGLRGGRRSRFNENFPLSLGAVAGWLWLVCFLQSDGSVSAAADLIRLATAHPASPRFCRPSWRAALPVQREFSPAASGIPRETKFTCEPVAHSARLS
jgi:hypothetical protein